MKRNTFIILIVFMMLLGAGNGYTIPSGDKKLTPFNIKGETFFSIECRDVDIKDLLRAIAKENDINLIVSEDINAKVTLSFEKISLKSALNTILKANKLAYIEEDGVIRIIKEEDLPAKEEEKKEASAEKKIETITAIVTLRYASSSELKENLSEIMPDGSSVSADERTNSLILNVDKEEIDNIKEIIRKLDTQPKQIMIKAWILETTSDFTKELGVQWGGSYVMNSAYGNATQYSFPNSIGIAGGAGSGTYAVNMPVSGSTSGVGINLGSINNVVNLDLRLSAMEKSGKIKIISEPHIATLNNKPAKIHSGMTYRVRTSSNVTSGDTTSLESELEQINVGVDLIVTPKVSYGDLIELKISATKSEADFSKVVDGIPGIIDKNAETTVLVKNGETTVIGGLDKNINNEVTNSVPFFSKIPFIGWMFKQESKIDSNEKLLILITPILIEDGNINTHMMQYKEEYYDKDRKNR